MELRKLLAHQDDLRQAKRWAGLWMVLCCGFALVLGMLIVLRWPEWGPWQAALHCGLWGLNAGLALRQAHDVGFANAMLNVGDHIRERHRQ